MEPWNAILSCANNLNRRITVIGFGEDYMLATIYGGCPGCNGVVEAVDRIFSRVNCVFVVMSDLSCINGTDENHIWLREEDARKLFPPINEHRPNANPGDFAGVKLLLAQK